MKIGITFDLKSTLPAGAPDDAQEEFDSPHTIEAIAAALRGLGHATTLLGDNRDMVAKVLAEPPDLVFNFAEGTGISRAREARVPAFLDLMGIPYTGSDAWTMAITLDKDAAKKIVAPAGVPVAPGLLLQPGHRPNPARLAALKFPVIVKPAWEGSSKGIRNKCLVKTPAELGPILASLAGDHRQPILIEEFIQGLEVTVGVCGNEEPKILGMMGIEPCEPVEHFVYSLEVKRDYRKMVNYLCPPPLPAATLDALQNAALTAFRALGCRDIARIDFRVRDGVPYFLEVNPLPGLNPDDSDLVIMSRLQNWTYAQLIETILNATLQRIQPV